MRPLLFDASALVALFEGHVRVGRLWVWAEREAVTLLLPAAAIAAANQRLQASDNAWEAVLLTPNVIALDLTPATGLAVSRYPLDLATGHAAAEAAATGATIVTAAPEAYPPPLRTAGL